MIILEGFMHKKIGVFVRAWPCERFEVLGFIPCTIILTIDSFHFLKPRIFSKSEDYLKKILLVQQDMLIACAL